MNQSEKIQELSSRVAQALEGNDLKTLASAAHDLFLLSIEDEQKETGNTDGVSPVIVCKRGFILIQGSIEPVKATIEQAAIPYALSSEARTRSETGSVLDEDVIVTFAANGIQDRTFRIIQPFTRRGRQILWGDKEEGYESRLEKMTAISDLSHDGFHYRPR